MKKLITGIALHWHEILGMNDRKGIMLIFIVTAILCFTFNPGAATMLCTAFAIIGNRPKLQRPLLIQKARQGLNLIKVFVFTLISVMITIELSIIATMIINNSTLAVDENMISNSAVVIFTDPVFYIGTVIALVTGFVCSNAILLYFCWHGFMQAYTRQLPASKLVSNEFDPVELANIFLVNTTNYRRAEYLFLRHLNPNKDNGYLLFVFHAINGFPSEFCGKDYSTAFQEAKPNTETKDTAWQSCKEMFTTLRRWRREGGKLLRIQAY